MMSPDTLLSQIGSPDQPLIVDVRIDEDFAEWPYLLPNSVRRPHHTVFGLQGPAITLCHQGLKLSLGAAALLRFEGQNAVRLNGGAVAWQEANGVGIPFHSLPASKLWTMLEGAEAQFASWIVKRFFPHSFALLAVPDADLPAVSDRFSAPITTGQELLDLIQPLPLSLQHMIKTSDPYMPLLSHASQSQAFAICDAHFAQSKEATT